MHTTCRISELQYYIDYIIEHCILAVAFFLPLSLNVTSVFLTLGSVLWISKMLIQRRINFRRTPYDWIVILFILLSAASIGASPDRGFSFYNYYHLMGRYILVYYWVINNVFTRDQLKRLVWAIMMSALFVTLYGFYQYYHGIDISAFEWVDKDQFPDLTVRVYSTLENPNLLAGFLVMMIALAGGLGIITRSIKVKAAFLGLAGLFAVCLVFTYSRGAWLSIIAVIVIYALLYNRRLVWLLLLVPIVTLFAHHVIMERLTSILNPTDTSATMRMALWESTLAMISDKPFLGIGWGAYWLVYPQYDFFVKDASVKIFHAHNTYLHLAAEIGIPGLLAFLTVGYLHLRAAVKVMKKQKGCWIGGLMLGLVAAITGLAVNGLTDHIIFNIQMCMMFWLINAVIIVAKYEAGPKS